LKQFILKVVDHFANRASQRENIADRAYKIYDGKKGRNKKTLNELLPEYLDKQKKIKLIPDETTVLVGYSTSTERLDWYLKEGKYIFRMDGDIGALKLSREVVEAKFLLLREKSKNTASKLYEITSDGPEVFSYSKLQYLKYPASKKPKEYYLSIDIKEVEEGGFSDKFECKFKNLKGYKDLKARISNFYELAGTPFTTTLTELMNEITQDH